MLGEQFGEYQIEQLISQGGMGEVYRARHRELGRVVAIKVLRAGQADPEQSRQRFLVEARVLSNLQHPGLVTVFDFGHSATADGRPYLIMEYLEGDTLRQRLERLRQLGGRMEGERALRLAQQVAMALGHAHREGIIHRDLKPENIMLAADPEHLGRERTKLIDFGLSKWIQERQPESGSVPSQPGSTPTREGMLLGTPQYMAPEVWQGASAATAKADVYAFGLILYEIFSGSFPFSVSSPSDLQELLWNHLAITPPPLDRHNAALPGALVDLVQAMLCKPPEQRPSMDHVSAILTGLAEIGERMTQLPILPAQRFWRRPFFHFGLGIVVSLAAFIIWWGLLSLRPLATAAHIPQIPVGEPSSHTTTAPGSQYRTGMRPTWVPVQSGSRKNLYALWGSSPQDVWAVGGEILHWNGEKWSERSGLDSGVQDRPDLRGVWGFGSRNAWAVGKHGLILHWDGQKWNPIRSGTTETLYAIWGTGPRDVWVVGEAGTILHFTGGEFSAGSRVTWHSLRSIWGSSPSDIWVVGAGAANDGIVVRGDGRSWKAEKQPVRLNSVWGSGPRDVWMVGGTKDNQGRVYRFDGERLVERPSGPAEWLQAVFGTGPGDIWVAGDHDVLLHHDGGTFWPAHSGSNAMLRALWGSQPNDFWAVATDGQIFHFDGRQE